MPGLPMFGHGQIEGFHEKYGMEYKQSYWNEEPDGHLIWLHQQRIFPLLRCRGLFSGSEHFVLYDFFAGDAVNEDVFAYSNRAGEQRGLVLYHNRYATTSGWVRESVAFAANDAGDGSELRRTTLAAALNLVDDNQVYYSFRDHTLSLVFLRNSRELSEKGLYAELGEYEFHVFTDFREIREDADGTWGRLCTALNGCGVVNLQDELKQLQYAELNAAFRAVLGYGTAAITSAAAYKKGFATLIRRFMTALAAQTKMTSAHQRMVQDEVPAYLVSLDALKTLTPSAKPAREALSRAISLLDVPNSGQLLLAWLLFKSSRIELDQYGLDYSLKQVGKFDTQAEGHRSVRLLQALLSLEPVGSVDSVALLEKAFSTTDSRDFMLVHESGGTEWFNKERYEELLEWFSIISLLELAASKSTARTITIRLGRLAVETTRLAELAIHAGYRTTLLLHLLKPVEKDLVTSATKPLSRKPARKKTDVQGTTRAKAAKTPDNKVPL
jgi:hypothetical protein